MRILIAFLVCFLLAAVTRISIAEVANSVPVGAAIYRQGTLPSGGPLRGQRITGGMVEGAAAACVNCHRRSGLGTAEGRFLIPPIAGKYLFRPHGSDREDIDYRYGVNFPPNFKPYNDETLARAIRDGIAKDGRKLNELMPRFELDADAMAALIAYLKSLSSGPVPGVSGDTLHFATVITPDADPVKRQGMLDVLERFFADKNEFIRGGVHPMRTVKQVMYRVTRKWRLHVWELSGPPESWEQQLHERMAAEPVFAVVSGLGGKIWAPVHRFCEREAVPCLMPNVELPVVAEQDFYSIYFSRGVLLEAQLMAFQLLDKSRRLSSRRVIQVFREDDVGKLAAASLGAAMAGAESDVVNRTIAGIDPKQELVRILADWKSDDALILWLRPGDLILLPPGIKGDKVFMSGLMGGMEHAPLPAGWHRTVRMAYPFDLPERRQVGMNFPLGWFRIRHIAIVDERVQSDTYLACRILSESMGDMLESFFRDYLVEQIETMLSKRLVNGYYPRLGLAPGQRFASKGGYIVRFAADDGTHLIADSDWIVP
jgi:mono/diheme cytochrome c family protein